MFGGYAKILLISGAIFPEHLVRLGLATKAEGGGYQGFAAAEGQSVIDQKRRQVHIDRVHGRYVTGKSKEADFEHFAKVIVDVLSPKFPGGKGILHVTSDWDAERFARIANLYALRRSKQRAALTGKELAVRAKFTAVKSVDVDKGIKKFKAAPGDIRPGEQTMFLILPRCYEGLDLSGSQARLNLFLKIPQANPADAVVQAIDLLIPNYSSLCLVASVIHGSQGSTRERSDWSFTSCLDTSAERYLAAAKELLPAYARDSVVVETGETWVAQWEKPPE